MQHQSFNVHKRMISCSQGFYEYVSLLLKHGARVALPDVEGKTPLHWAASSDAAVAAAAASSNNSNASHASAAKYEYKAT